MNQPNLQAGEVYQFDRQGNKGIFLYSEDQTFYFLPVNEYSKFWPYWIMENGLLGFSVGGDYDSIFFNLLIKHNERLRAI